MNDDDFGEKCVAFFDSNKFKQKSFFLEIDVQQITFSGNPKD